MTTTKYKSHGSFNQERKAKEKLAKVSNGNTTKFHIHKKTWNGKDKTRYQVREITRKGSKR